MTFAYAMPAFALAFVSVPVFVYLPRFYTDVVGVDVTTLGAIVLACRASDALVDPITGYLSDRTRSRLGRRGLWIAVSAPLLAVIVAGLYVPPHARAATTTWWCLAGLFLFFLLLSTLGVPYRALGAELTRDPRERVRLFGFREGTFIVGSVAAMAAPPAIGAALGLGHTAAAERARFACYAAVAAPIILAAAIACVAIVPERPVGAPHARGRVFDGTRDALRSGPFRVLLAAYTMAAFGNNLPGALVTYYGSYVLGIDDAGLYLLAFLFAGLAALPLWNRYALGAGKKRAWLAAIAANTIPFAFVFLLGRGDRLAYLALVTLSGVGAVATVTLAPAMQADVIDYDELIHDARREGQFVGLWSIAEKLAAALGVGVALPLLAAAGYVPNAVQSPRVLLALRALYVLVPCACNAIAFALMWRFPIDPAAQRAIVEGIARRRAGAEVPDPLLPSRLLPGIAGGEP